MTEQTNTTQPQEQQPLSAPLPDGDVLHRHPPPAGGHPLEIAARAGIGPLSTLGQRVWHGEAIPCLTCGQLVRRNATRCEACGQDLSEEMIARMRKHAGPWYVLEHLRPFPGVTLERILLQMRRGLITPTSIVRGPATDYQWRFAVETPGLCRLFGRCWNCYHGVRPAEAYCPACLSYLGFDKPASTTAVLAPKSPPLTQRPGPTSSAPAQAATRDGATSKRHAELSELARAARNAHKSQQGVADEVAPPSASLRQWIALFAIAVVFALLMWFTTLRTSGTTDLISSPASTQTLEAP